MSQSRLNFSVRVTADPAVPGKWLSPAFRLPGVRIVGAQRQDGTHVDGSTLSDGQLLTPASADAVAFATLEVPGDLIPQSNLDEQKFALEREKAHNEEANRKRTFLWSVGAALLSAAVTLVAAFAGKSDGSRPVTGASADAIQACHASLKRLPLLARDSRQTVQSIAEAIDRHEADCDDVLVKTLGAR